MIVLSWLYVNYRKLPQVADALYILKPAVLGIIAAGIIKLARAAISNVFLAILLIGSFAGMYFAGAIVATFFVFLPSFVFVLGGAHYVEKVRDNKPIQAFLAGVSAGVVGVIAVVSLDLIAEALVGWPSVVIFVAAFLLIVWAKIDVALVAIGAIVGGILYSLTGFI